MSFPFIQFSEQHTKESLAAWLFRTMKAERSGHKLSGYYFVFAEHSGDNCSFAKATKRMQDVCGYFAQASIEEHKGIKLFKNCNGQIACKLH